MSERTCIVTREVHDPADLIRFVRAPDGSVVPDLKRRLPGRGAHTAMRRTTVDAAMARKRFARAFRAEVTGPPDLGASVDALLAKAALGALGLARKAGQLVTGAAKVEAALKGGRAVMLVQASDGSPAGLAKVAGRHEAGAGPPRNRTLSASELGLALGGDNVIHAAVLAGHAGTAAAERLSALARYRGEGDPCPAPSAGGET